jgi:hypothetical protein
MVTFELTLSVKITVKQVRLVRVVIWLVVILNT